MTTISRRRRLQRADIIARIVHHIVNAIAVVLMGALLAWVLVNWVTGCGEVFHTVDGTIMGECVLVPWVDPNTYDHFIE